jgi:hypothetical protein
MSRYRMLMLLLILPVLCTAQSLNDNYMFPGDENWEDPVYEVLKHPEFDLGGMLGTIMMDGSAFTQVRIRPEMAIWKLGLGVDIDLLIDGEGKIRREGWDNWQDILRKIFYVRFADRSDSLYFKVGSIPDYTLGHGLIFDDYSNMLRYPDEKPVGGYFGANTNSYGFGFEVYTHDISQNNILAARAFMKPLQSIGIPIIRNLKVGVNLGADRNPYSKYPDSDGDGYPDVYDKFPQDKTAWLDTDNDEVPDNRDIDLNGNSILDHPDLNQYVEEMFPGIDEYYPNYPFDTAVYPDSAQQLPTARPMWVYSVDYDLSLSASERFSISHYAEYAIMKDHGTGLIFPGFAARFAIFDAKLEMRAFSGNFLPAYFNNLYDEQRCQVVDTQTQSENGRRVYLLRTKDEQLTDIKPSLGWFGYLKGNIANFAYLKVAYQDMYNDSNTKGKSLWGKLTLMPDKFPKLKEASLYYAMTDVDSIDIHNLRNENAEISGRIVYGYNEYYNIIGKYTQYYKDVNGDGIISGKDETVDSISFGVEFQF